VTRRAAAGAWAATWFALLLAPALPASASTESPVWSGYLDYAYIYSSADAASLRARLDSWGAEAGIPLERYIADYFETLAPLERGQDETAARRCAIAYLLDYLASGDANSLERSARVLRSLDGRLERQENRYWHHYILAHRALERSEAREFTEQVLELWSQVIVPLEATYQTLETLALEESANAGFSSALPYLYESVARMVLLRSQELGVDRELDPLGAVVRMLHDGRIGAQPELIPPEVSARAYLERIVERLEGAESDDGSLTFTLALFEAGKHHDAARAALASDGLAPETVKLLRRTVGAYETALNRAQTAQGECAVYTRVLRVIGEVYAAQQRLGVDAGLELPFSVEGATRVYAKLHAQLEGGHEDLGYRNAPRGLYIEAMHRLWEEIQEASLNAGDYYLSRSAAGGSRADELARSAARSYGRYLTFFHQHALESGREALPDSAYFAAFEAAKGVGDAFLRHAERPSSAEEALAIERWRSALLLFPFDRELWPAITAALGRRGRESEYPLLVQPIAERVVRSRAVATWTEQDGPHAQEIAAVRRALADPLVVMYMGFADASELDKLESELGELAGRRARLTQEIAELERQRDERRRAPHVPAARDPDAGFAAQPELTQLAQSLAERSALLGKLEQQIAARTRALPLYRETLTTDGLGGALRGRRDHPVHLLLARMFYESRAAGPDAAATARALW
jgi:hypothetical protein